MSSDYRPFLGTLLFALMVDIVTPGTRRNRLANAVATQPSKINIPTLDEVRARRGMV